MLKDVEMESVHTVCVCTVHALQLNCMNQKCKPKIYYQQQHPFLLLHYIMCRLVYRRLSVCLFLALTLLIETMCRREARAGHICVPFYFRIFV